MPTPKPKRQLFPTLSPHPHHAVFFGAIIDDFGDASTPDELVDNVTESAILILYLAVAAFAASYLQVAFFTLTAQRQALRIRRMYFTALVRQDMAWFDHQATGALSSRISADIPKIQEAIGDKVASFLQFFGMFIAGFAVGFAYGWKLTLVILAITPIMGAGGALMSKMLSEAASGGQGYYAAAGAVADEVLHMIRTVVAFDTQDKVRWRGWERERQRDRQIDRETDRQRDRQTERQTDRETDTYRRWCRK